MKKLVAFSLATLLFLSGCGNQPTVPADPLPVTSQTTNSTTEPSDTPYIPKETIVETASDVPAKKTLDDPESKPTTTEIVPVPQAGTNITTPQKPQYAAEIDLSVADIGISYSSSAGRNDFSNVARSA